MCSSCSESIPIEYDARIGLAGPVWGRGFHALAHRAMDGGAAVAIAFAITEQRLLFIAGAVAVWRAIRRDDGPGSTRILATFATLIVALSLLARDVG